MVAAMSLCDGKVQGMVVGANTSLEILPLNNRLKRMLNMWQDVRLLILFLSTDTEFIYLYI